MTCPVCLQLLLASETLSAFGTLVLTAVNNHVLLQVTLDGETFLAQSTGIRFYFSVY